MRRFNSDLKRVLILVAAMLVIMFACWKCPAQTNRNIEGETQKMGKDIEIEEGLPPEYDTMFKDPGAESEFNEQTKAINKLLSKNSTAAPAPTAKATAATTEADGRKILQEQLRKKAAKRAATNQTPATQPVKVKNMAQLQSNLSPEEVVDQVKDNPLGLRINMNPDTLSAWQNTAPIGKTVFSKQVENQNNDYLTTDKTISMDKDLASKGLQ